MWVGRTTAGIPTRGAGALLCWAQHDQVIEVWTGLTQPNGMGWSPDGRTFYLVDTADQVLLRAAFDLESGRLVDTDAFLRNARLTRRQCCWVPVIRMYLQRCVLLCPISAGRTADGPMATGLLLAPLGA
jgi:hypothetical protein